MRIANPLTSAPSAIMSREAPLSVAERDFILDALHQNVRLDGRGPDQTRPLSISFGNEYGHVKLRLGKTRWVPLSFPSKVFLGDADSATSIVVRISAEVTKPRDDRPFDGLFDISLELSAMGSPAWENGRYAN